MKNNTNELKSHLRKALVSAPDDFSLREVKSYIIRAIEAVEAAEGKRFDRQASVERRSSNQFIPNPSFSYMAIERELALEKSKLEQIVSKKVQRNDNLITSSEQQPEEIQNVFG